MAWSLTWEDNFDGASLDLDKWHNFLPWGSQTNYNSNGERQHYETANVTVSGGLLHITAREESAQYSEGDPPVQRTYPWSSGCVHSAAHFEQAYGKFEASIRWPGGNGFWPAFWMCWKGGSDGFGWWPWPPEIDILEADGANVTQFTQNYHYGTGAHYAGGTRSQAGPNTVSGAVDLTAAFHTYAVEWSPGLIIWYLDGVEKFRTTTNVTDVPMYLILNLAVDGTWISDPDETTPFPSEMQVDYVRVYEWSEDGGDVASEEGDGVISIWEPAAGRNQVVNPSFENGTSTWQAANSATISRVYSYAVYGAACAKVVTGNAGTNEGIVQSVSSTVTPSTTYVVSCWLRGSGTVRIGWDEGAGATYLTTQAGPTITLTSTWTRYEYSAQTTASTTTVSMVIFTPTQQASTFYVDGFQFEVGSVATSYIDGDQPGCAWDGAAHQSQSTRSSQYRAGGVLRNLDSYVGIRTVAIVGLGATTFDLLDRQYSTMPGNVVDGYKAKSRDFTLILILKSTTLSAYHAARKKLAQLFLPTRVYPPGQPLRIRYTGASASVEVDAYYVSGLEGEIQGGTGNFEKIAINCRSADPYVYEVAAPEQTALSTFTTRTVNSLITNVSGVWNTAFVTTTTARINAIYSYSGGLIVGGSFTNLNGVTGATNLARIDSQGTVYPFNQGSAGALGEVYRIVPYSARGGIAICGAFTAVAGVNYTRGVCGMTLPGTSVFSLANASLTDGGVNGTAYDAVAVGNGLYVVGSFGSAMQVSGVANTKYFYKWQDYNVTALHGGTVDANGSYGPLCRSITFDGIQTLLVGGYFSKLKSTSGLSNLAAYNVSTGLVTNPGTVGPIGGLPVSLAHRGVGDDYVVGGTGITSVRGVACANVARRVLNVWRSVGTGFGGDVAEVRWNPAGDTLYAAGKFAGGVSYYDSSWHSMGLTIPAGDYARTLEVSGAYPYVGMNGQATVPTSTTGTVTVTSTAKCYPRFSFPWQAGISGTPQISAIRNETTNQAINVAHTLISGETYTVDCDYQPDPLQGPVTMRKRIYSSLSGPLPGDLQTGSDLAGFALVPGENVISILASDSSGTPGSVVVQYRKTHESADV